MSSLGLILYRIFVVPLVVIALPFLAVFNAKIREGLRRRRKRVEFPEWATSPIWIHAASGEFEYAKSVIREIKSRDPDIPVVVSYFSPTFARAAEQFPGVDLAVALPLDLPSPCRAFVRRLRPRLLLVARTDLWPEMLEQCRIQNIPVVLFSCTQKALHSRLRKAFRRWTLRWVKQIYCVAEADDVNLKDLGCPSEILGDTRYDQVAFRLSQPKPLHAALKPAPGIPCLVAGSTWAEDEAVLLPALKEHLQSGQLKLILVPHEPSENHLRNVAKQLEGLGLPYALFSENKSWDEKPVLLVDRVGYLAELYQWGTFGFVGGSFRKTVHSVMEALGARLLTYIGPKHENNREAMEFKALRLGEFSGLQVVTTSNEWHDHISQALAQKEAVTQFQEQLGREFDRRLGASAKLVSLLLRRG